MENETIYITDEMEWIKEKVTGKKKGLSKKS